MKKLFVFAFASLIAVSMSAQKKSKTTKQTVKSSVVIDYINDNFDTYDKLQKEIWNYSEVGFQEVKSSKALKDHLAANGFRLTEGIAGEPTAFIAEYGSGKPIIGIVAEFDVVCGKDNYFFGRMIQNLQVSENYVFDFYYNSLNNTKMISDRDMKEYDLILSRCHGRISSSNTYEQNLEILRQEYHYPTVLDCKEFFEGVKGISLEKLFECNFKQKSNSEQLAEGIVNKWIEDIRAQKNLKYYEAEGCNTLTVLLLQKPLAHLLMRLLFLIKYWI